MWCVWFGLSLSEVTGRSSGTNTPRAVATTGDSASTGTLVATADLTLTTNGPSIIHQVLEVWIKLCQRPELAPWVTVQVSVDLL